MLKTLALIGSGIAIGCYYQSCKNDSQTSKCKKSSKDSGEATKEQLPT